MLTRKIGKFLRGQATPFQIISATVLGALLAAVPGFGQAPLLLLSLLFTLVILNANLFISGLTFLVAKVLYWLMLPLSFSVGIWLAEGPLRGLLSALVNAPVLAWFGLEYYVALPALLVHGCLGVALGVFVSRSLQGFRHTMATLERGSEAYKRYTDKTWVRLAGWLFFGGLTGKQSWEEASASKSPGLPFRPIGMVLVALLCVLGYVGFKVLDDLIVTQYTRDVLERVNGATVDVAGVTIDPVSERITIRGLALADPGQLDRNRFEAETLVADLSGMSLLAKRVVVDRIEVSGARCGAQRRLPGKLTQPPMKSAKPEREPIDPALFDYLEDADKWRDRLSSLKRLYDQLAPYLSKDRTSADGAEATTPNWREQLAERAREAGYARVAADSLIARAPRILLRQLEMGPITVEGASHTFALEASNLSSHPALIAERGRVQIARSDGNMAFEMELPSAARPTLSSFSVTQRQIPIDFLKAETGGKLPFEGGTLQLGGEGEIEGGLLNLPLSIVVQNTVVRVADRTVSLREVPLQVRLHGPLEQPRIELPKDALKEALLKSGQQQVEQLIQDKAGDSLRKLLPIRGGQ